MRMIKQALDMLARAAGSVQKKQMQDAQRCCDRAISSVVGMPPKMLEKLAPQSINDLIPSEEVRQVLSDAYLIKKKIFMDQLNEREAHQAERMYQLLNKLPTKLDKSEEL
jgi:hypothetical protein